MALGALGRNPWRFRAMARPPKAGDSGPNPRPKPDPKGAAPKDELKEDPPKAITPLHLRRARGFAKLGDCATPLLRPAFEKRGFAEARIAADWTTLVGERLARVCRPVKIQWRGGAQEGEGGVLVIGARGGAAMEIAHSAPTIVERINVFYGYRAVERLKVDQALAPTGAVGSARPPAPPPESPPPLRKPVAALDSIADPALRAALERLARNRAVPIVPKMSNPPRKAT